MELPTGTIVVFVQLISFIDISKEENLITFKQAETKWQLVYENFSEMGFKSIVSERGWNNFVKAFEGDKNNESNR